MTDTIPKALAGDRRALARLITQVECGGSETAAILQALHPRGGNGYVVGITGPPGAGKSTLMAGLVRELRRGGDTVGIVAVDPTSPISGGAVLGDRVRMADLGADPGVYMRSMGSRGRMGGLSEAVGAVVAILDAMQFDWIFIETVGIGQTETDVAHYCDTTVVVCVPGTGDGIQIMKAGILEVADLYAVNKADGEGVDRLVMDLGVVASPRSDGWTPEIIRTVAVAGTGTSELMDGIQKHRNWQTANGRLEIRRRANCRFDLIRRVERQLFQRFENTDPLRRALDAINDQVSLRTMDPVRGGSELLRHVLRYRNEEERP